MLFVFFAKGGNPPFGSIVQKIYEKEIIPYFPRLYAGAFYKFSYSLIIIYSLLFGFGVKYIFVHVQKLTNRVKLGKFVILAIFFLLLVCSFPFWTGKIVNSPVVLNGVNVSSRVDIPKYYEDIKLFLQKDDSDYKIIALPLLPYNMGTYKWTDGYLGSSFEGNYFNRPVFSVRAFERIWDKGMLILSSGMNKGENINKIMGTLNIKYAILHYDMDLLYGNYSGKTLDAPEKLKKIFIKNNFSYIKSFGKLDLYEISDEYFLPHIYASPDKTGL